MERTRAEIARADVVLSVLDATAPAAAELTADVPRIDVFNKIDLVPAFRAPGDAVAVSAKTGHGLDALRAAILRTAGWQGTGQSVYLARERHLRALRQAREHLGRALPASAHWELFAEELRLAQGALAEVTGEVHSDDLLGHIFARFCIGK